MFFRERNGLILQGVQKHNHVLFTKLRILNVLLVRFAPVQEISCIAQKKVLQKLAYFETEILVLERCNKHL